MFSKDTLIKMCDGHNEELGPLAVRVAEGTGAMALTKSGGGAIYSALGEGTTEIISLQTSVGEYMELVTNSGRRVKCALRAKVMLTGGGFTYAQESNHAIVDTETGPEIITGMDQHGNSEDLVSVRLGSVHVLNANGIWFLVD